MKHGVLGTYEEGKRNLIEEETNAEIRVPLFINIGDFVKVDTEKGEYNERVKK